MTTLKNAISKALFAAGALAAGDAALAQNVSPTYGASDVFVAVWNPATNTSFVQDLGSSWSFSQLASSTTFNNPSGFSLTASLDAGNLATDLGAGTYSFDLFAGSLASTHTSTQFLGATYYLSEATGVGPTQLTNGAVFTNAGANGTAAYLNRTDTLHCNPSPCTQSSFKNTNSTNYWANSAQPGGNFGLTGFQGAASGTGAVELWRYVATSATDSAADPTTLTNVGNASHNGQLTLNDTTGVLTYSLQGSGSTVPLPAAAWLLVSGLLGLGAVARRKAATAV